MQHNKVYMYISTHIVVWITYDPCLESSESDLRLHINFESCEEKKFRDIQKQTYCSTRSGWWQENQHISEDVASDVQVGDVEHAIVWDLLK